MSPAKRVMVIDDDRDIRAALADVLQDEGYQVVGAANGQDALDQLARGVAPGVLLLDLMMPVMDGYEFYARWCTDAALKKIPLYVVTAGRLGPEHPPLTEATGVLTKPVQLDELLELLARHFTW